MKRKKEQGIFFSDPSDSEISQETKKTIETFVECENVPVDTGNLGVDYKRIINLSYGQDRSKKKKKIVID